MNNKTLSNAKNTNKGIRSETYMNLHIKQYQEAHKTHMDVIRRYSEGLLSFSTYIQLDTKYQAEKDLLSNLANAYLYHHN